MNDAVEGYFGKVAPWLEKEIAAGRADGNYAINENQLAGTIVPAVQDFFAVRPLAMFLTPEVRPTDPSTFVSVAAALFAVALAATVAPALRALRIDPITALHND